MKIRLMVMTLCLACISLAGCWDRTEINDLAIVTGLAFDRGKDDRLIQLTVQIFIPKSQKGDSTDGGSAGESPHTIVRYEEGYNAADALSKLQRTTSRKLFWGQCKVFIFSDAVATAGIREHFDFLVRHPQPRERAFMFVSKGKASEALRLLPPMERTSAEVLRELAKNKIGIGVTLEELSIMLKGESRSAVLPIIRILPPEKPADSLQTNPFILGTAVFKKDKMIGEISEKVTRGVMWIRNDIEEYTVTFRPDQHQGDVSLNPVKASVKLIPKIEGNKWKMTIKVRTEGDMIQNGTLSNPMNPDFLNQLEQAFAEDVQGRIQLALREVQQGLKADIFDFAQAFQGKYPRQWEQAKDRWEELFPKVEVRTDVKAYISRPGLTNSPGGVTEEEVSDS